MKKFYPNVFVFVFFPLLLFSVQKVSAQCPNGQPSWSTSFDTTIKFPTGATNMPVKFPKFNPLNGMLTCVRLVVNIVGVVDSVAMQNFSGSSQTANFYYDRSDNMTGPGLNTPISNTFNGHYGPQNLTAYDNVMGAGSDFYSISKDTVLRKSMTRLLNDSTEISQFYGTDSVTYNYNINVSTSAIITGGSSSSLVLTSALVNFRFEYCTCPLSTLPIGLRNFTLAKASTNAIDLRWQADAGNDNYFYEIEMSRDGQHFSKVGVQQKTVNNGKASYQYFYPVKPTDFGRFYFRVKQRWFDGYYRYTDIRSIEFSNPVFSTVSVYPNPSSGSVGLKFIAAKAGNYQVEISNAAGQIISRKDLVVAETDFKKIGLLQKGMYYVKITEQSTQAFSTHQFYVQ